MKRAALCLLLAAQLQGCALLPEGSEGGMWIRIGPDANMSAAHSFRVGPRDPRWRCPKGEDALGVPPGTLLDCDPRDNPPTVDPCAPFLACAPL